MAAKSNFLDKNPDQFLTTPAQLTINSKLAIVIVATYEFSTKKYIIIWQHWQH